MDRILNKDDVAGIAERILTVQTKSRALGRLLKVPKASLDAIHQEHRDPQERLFGVLDEFVKQVEPIPTWNIILEALRNPLIGEFQLAQEIHTDLSPADNGFMELARQLDSKFKSREAEIARKEVELARKEAELTEAKKATRREQQEIQKKRQRETQLVEDKNRELALLRQQLRQKEAELSTIKTELTGVGKDTRKKQQEIQEMRQQMINLEEDKDGEQAQLRHKLRKKKKQLQSRDGQLADARRRMRQKKAELATKEAQLTETIRREQQTTQEMRQRETQLVQELALIQQQLRQKEKIQWFFMLSFGIGVFFLFSIIICLYVETSDITPCHVSQVSGPGITSATVNHPTYIVLELTVSKDTPCSLLQLNVTVQLQLLSKATPNVRFVPTPTVQFVATSTTTSSKNISHYILSYTPVIRGQYKLHVQANDTEINGSPFMVTVYPDYRELDLPVTNLNTQGCAHTGRWWPFTTTTPVNLTTTHSK